MADQRRVPGWRLELEVLRHRRLELVARVLLVEPMAPVVLRVMVHHLVADRMDLDFVGCLLGA